MSTATGTVAARERLLPFTQLVLVVSAVVQLVFGFMTVFWGSLFHDFFWPEPLTPFSEGGLKLGGVNYIATAVAASYALRRGTWEAARVYLAFSFPYVVMGAVVLAWLAADVGAVPGIFYLYWVLSALYLPAVIFAWYQQSGRSSRS